MPCYRNMKETVITKLIVILLAYESLAQESENPFKLRFDRPQGSNLIKLFCQERIGATFTEIRDASFFIDGSVINSSDSSPFTHSATRLTFSMTRDLEGLYSCGNESIRPQSNLVPLVGEY